MTVGEIRRFVDQCVTDWEGVKGTTMTLSAFRRFVDQCVGVDRFLGIDISSDGKTSVAISGRDTVTVPAGCGLCELLTAVIDRELLVQEDRLSFAVETQKKAQKHIDELKALKASVSV